MIDEEYDSSKAKRFEYANAHDLNVFDANSLKGIERLEIEGDCFIKVNRFEIDGLNELKSVMIGREGFYLNKENRKGSKCLIMNCDWMNDEWDLIRLQSIILGYDALEGDSRTMYSDELIMKSMNDGDDWLMRSSFSINDRWIFPVYRQSDIGEW